MLLAARPRHIYNSAQYLFFYRQLNWLFAFFLIAAILSFSVVYTLFARRHTIDTYVQNHVQDNCKCHLKYQRSNSHSLAISFGICALYHQIQAIVRPQILVLVINKENDATSLTATVLAFWLSCERTHNTAYTYHETWKSYRSIRKQ